MAQPTAAEAPVWYDFVTNFDRAYASFQTNYDALLRVGPVVARHPGLFPDYDRLVNEGADIYNKLESLKATRDYAASWLNWLRGGARGVFNWIGGAIGLQGLGALPVLLTLGAAGALLTSITYYLTEVAKFAERSNMVLELERSGRYTPAQIAELVTGTLGKPASGNLFGIPFELLAFAAVAIFVGPPLIKAISGTRK